jgi:hypothetical protein
MLLPVPTQVLERTDGLGNPATLFSLLLLAFAVLACAVVGACLRWRAAWTDGGAEGPRQSTGEAWAARVLLLTAIVWLAAAGLGAYGSAPLGSDMTRVFFDFPSAPLVASLALVLTAAALTLASLMLLWPVWQVGSWPMWRRVRHTGVVVAAVVACAVLLHFNAVGFNYLPH